jgi:hypothetical protein
MLLQISDISNDPRRLTQQLVQVLGMLDLYQAELARILHLQCADIARLANGQSLLEPTSNAWALAQKFIRLYQLLYRKFDADGVHTRNWLRRHHRHFNQTPHLMLVDEEGLEILVNYLSSSTQVSF